MSLLANIRFVQFGDLGGVCARFLETLGAVRDEAVTSATDIIIDGRETSAARYQAEADQILVRLTPFGLDGPYAGYLGSELVCSAMGGTLIGTGYEDLPPVKEALDACIFHAEGVAAAGALFAPVSYTHLTLPTKRIV